MQQYVKTSGLTPMLENKKNDNEVPFGSVKNLTFLVTVITTTYSESSKRRFGRSSELRHVEIPRNILTLQTAKNNKEKLISTLELSR